MTTTRCGARSRERFDWLDTTSRHSRRSRRCSRGAFPTGTHAWCSTSICAESAVSNSNERLVDAGRELPTIFITALEAETVSEPLAALDPVAVLYKPFGKEDLLAAIERACDAGRP